MKVKIRNELIPINLLVLALAILITFFPSNLLRIIIGLPFMLFFPGYVFMAALMPRRTALDGIERVLLSFATSFTVILVIGLILNYTPWGITVESTLYSMVSFMLAMSTVAYVIGRWLGEVERPSLEFRLGLPEWGSGWNKILTVALVVAILGALGVLTYIIVMPKTGEEFTEFYVQGQSGGSDYGGELVVGRETKFVLGIINNEKEMVSYRIVMKVDGEETRQLEPVVLAGGEKREVTVSFTPQTPGENRKVEFLLYKQGQNDIYRSLSLWVDVRQ